MVVIENTIVDHIVTLGWNQTLISPLALKSDAFRAEFMEMATLPSFLHGAGPANHNEPFTEVHTISKCYTLTIFTDAWG